MDDAPKSPYKFHVVHDEEHDIGGSMSFWIICYQTEDELQKKLEGHSFSSPSSPQPQ